MNIKELRKDIAVRITVFNTLVMVIIIVAYDINSEITTLISILSPISAIYFGILAQHIGNTIRDAALNENTTTEPLNSIPYAKLTKWIISIHFILIIIVVILKPLGLGLNFKQTVIVLGLIETLFGVYLGYIITAIFNINPPKNN